MKLLLDINVIVDVLARRKPWVDDAAAVLSLLDDARAEGFVAVHTITTIEYLLTKDLNRKRAAAALVDLLRLVRVVPVDHDMILKALSLGWKDFEDAVQAVCALEIGADYVVSRDPEDFSSFSIPVVTPSELLTLVARDQDDRP
ncbi:MAG: PIN domain-containing protein [Gemmatimonadetes bacterium]|nr:PIN domain-containing protein [Gemmatimonadota bacterium]MBI2402677.1 PIN domain-containing protein [Gemmatimonadota bacterium]MBI2535659.1 PIN domain-containing protein [Gemmatimonadota bacterium]